MLDKFNPPEFDGVSPKTEPKTEPKKSVGRLIRGMFNCRAEGHPSPIAARKGDKWTLLDVWNGAGYKEGAEIGVFRGHFSKDILDKVKGVKLHCIDAWQTYPSSQLTEDHQKSNYERTLKRLEPYLAERRCNIYTEFSEKAVYKFRDGSLDFVFIDGGHDFDSCVMDLVKWVPKVRKGGMVAVHDYCAMNRNGVVKAVDAYTYCHMIHPWYVTREVINTAFWVVR